MWWGAKCKDSKSEAPTKNDPSSSSSNINTDSRSHGRTSSSVDSAADYLIRPSKASAIKVLFVAVITGGIRLMSAPTGEKKSALRAAGGRSLHFLPRNCSLGRHATACERGAASMHVIDGSILNQLNFSKKLRRRQLLIQRVTQRFETSD